MVATTTTNGQTGKEQSEGKLMKATDLPSHGNPYPPKDVIDCEKPAFGKTQDIISIGVAHSQSSIQRLAENQSTVTKSLAISAACLFGYAIARRKGTFKKILYGSVFGGAAAAACFPQDAEDKAQLLWFMAKNKLPEMAKSQYQKLAINKKETDQPPSQSDSRNE